jgi:signal transduction histidine kinase
MLAVANAQHKHTDSLYSIYNAAKTDTDKLNALIGLSYYYELAYPDSAIIFGQDAYTISDKHNWIAKKAQSLDAMANAYSFLGDYVNAMRLYLRGLRIFETINDYSGMAHENNNIGATYIAKNDYKGALPYLRIAAKQTQVYTLSHKLRPGDMKLKAMIQENVAEAFIYLHQIDSALYYLDKCYPAALKDNMTDLIGVIQSDMGNVQSAKGNKTAALKYFRSAEISTLATGDVEDLSIAYLNTAKLYHKEKLQDSAEYYAKKAYQTASGGKFEQDVLNAGQVLYGYYDEDNNLPLAYKYFKLTTAVKDSLYSQDKLKQLLSIDFDERQRQEDIAAAQEKYKDQVRTYLFIAGLAVLLLVVLVIWRNGKQKQRALLQLQQTQKQLIHSEKMASLGELTAGIAHEIQNPLNFINNFSEVNIELLAEMKEELKAGQTDDAIGIADDVEQNLLKVIHHGKRADGIVKGMLQHSRTGSTTKEPTDINALADEYLRLAYHGLRAKDKSFNADMITDYAKNLPKANVLPQEIGRVLLNLYTNAFYTVQQKQKTAGDNYKPTVEVSTSSHKDSIVIKVRDNGMGMPEHVKEKIMQPFFTTKPTGEGTGLGLSMSYDIVVKGHEGEINVETKENDYTVFTITLPL